MKMSNGELLAYAIALMAFVAPFFLVRGILSDPGAGYLLFPLFFFVFLPFWIITYAGLRAASGEAAKRKKSPTKKKKTQQKYKSGRIYWR